MGMSINSNAMALKTQDMLTKGVDTAQKNVEKLSSGLRINKAADDGAGLAISNSMAAQIKGLGQARMNLNEGAGMLQIAEGGLQGITDTLQRLREISIQSSSGTQTAADRTYLQGESDALLQEINRISSETQYNGTKLLDGTGSITLQTGPGANDTKTQTIADVSTAGLFGGTTVDLSTQDGAISAMVFIDQALEFVSGQRSDLGKAMNGLEVASSNIAVYQESLSQGNSSITDMDILAETAAMTRDQMLTQSGMAVLAQANIQSAQAYQLLR